MISVKNVSKLYRIYEKPSGRLLEILLRGHRKYHRDFWALQDINIEVPRGEAVGIIGRNGAGKSTLLQIIAGILQPTTGDVKVEGRVTALLELGSGFNPEYTGRENILLSGQILGISEEEMRRRLDVIVEFAELRDFVDQPVKTYSTGMLMRLAFAAAIHVDPDILIVDEALSVGDAYFQRKSLDRMEHFRKTGKTVLFVTHDPLLVQRFCTQAVWIEGGKVAMSGNAKDVVTSYQAYCQKLGDEHLKTNINTGGMASVENNDIIKELELSGAQWGNGRIKFTGVEMYNYSGEETWIYNTGNAVIVKLNYESDDNYPDPVFAVDIHRFDGVFVGSINNFDTHPAPIPVYKGKGSIELYIPRLDLPYGNYFLSLKAYTENQYPSWTDPANIHNQMYQFDVVTDKIIHGIMQFDAEWVSSRAVSA